MSTTQNPAPTPPRQPNPPATPPKQPANPRDDNHDGKQDKA